MKILFVCLGNICRSPTAHGVMETKLQKQQLDWVYVDSAGTAAYHIGKSPDQRTQQAASSRGYDLSSLRARQATETDFFEFDYIFAMDKENLRNLERIRPANATATLLLALAFSDLAVTEVPDPYYGGSEGFDNVLGICENLCDDIIDQVVRSDRGR
jgi:protein-tyrosine phosphatase